MRHDFPLQLTATDPCGHLIRGSNDRIDIYTSFILVDKSFTYVYSGERMSWKFIDYDLLQVSMKYTCLQQHPFRSGC